MEWLLFVNIFLIIYSIIFILNKRLGYITPSKLFVIAYVIQILLSNLIIQQIISFPDSFIGNLFSDLFTKNNTDVYKILLLNTFGLVCFFIGRFFFGGKKIKDFNSIDEIQKFEPVKNIKVITYSTFGLAILLLTIFVFKFGIPLFSQDVNAAKYLASNNGGFFYLFVVFGYTMPFILGLNAIYYKRFRIKIFKTFAIIAGTIQLLSILSGYRIFSIICVIILAFIWNYQLKISKKKIVLFFAGAMAIFIGITFLKNPTLTPSALFLKFSHRVLFESFYSQRIIFDHFSIDNFLYGESLLWDVKSILPGRQVTFQKHVADLVGADNLILTPSLAGEMYANFGYFSLITFLLLGALMKRLDFIFMVNLYLDLRMVKQFLSLALLILAFRISTVGVGSTYFMVVAAGSYALFFELLKPKRI